MLVTISSFILLCLAFMFYTSLIEILQIYYKICCNSCLRGQVSICLGRTIIGPWKVRCLPEFAVWVFEQVESLWSGLQWGLGKMHKDDSYLDVWRVDTGHCRSGFWYLTQIELCACMAFCMYMRHMMANVCLTKQSCRVMWSFCTDLLPYSALETDRKSVV